MFENRFDRMDLINDTIRYLIDYTKNLEERRPEDESTDEFVQHTKKIADIARLIRYYTEEFKSVAQ